MESATAGNGKYLNAEHLVKGVFIPWNTPKLWGYWPPTRRSKIGPLTKKAPPRLSPTRRGEGGDKGAMKRQDGSYHPSRREQIRFNHSCVERTFGGPP